MPQKTAIRKEGEVCKNMFPKDKSKLGLSVLPGRCLELVENEQLNFETMLKNSNQLKQCYDVKNALQQDWVEWKELASN